VDVEIPPCHQPQRIAAYDVGFAIFCKSFHEPTSEKAIRFVSNFIAQQSLVIVLASLSVERLANKLGAEVARDVRMHGP
jgi:hypothetical protein